MSTLPRRAASACTCAALAVSAALALPACRAAPGTSGTVAPASRVGTLITEEEIARMSVRTAWDVVRMRAPRFTAASDENGRPTRVRIQEPATANADETPLLVVDGVPLSDIDYLQQIPASEVHLIRILRADTAEPIYGLRAAGGAIVVETKRGS